MLVKDNKYIPNEDKDFFILLRIGLWQRVEEPLSDNPNWEYIYNLSIEQTVQGLIADGIGIYRKEHPDFNIPQEWNDKFLSASAQIVRRNFAINQLQAEICKLFNAQNVQYIIMKGQAVAIYYPKPNLRCSGDIDFFFNVDNYEKAKKILTPLSDVVDPELKHVKHCGFIIGDVEVEFHAEDTYGIHRLKTLSQISEVALYNHGHEYYIYNSEKIYVAPKTYEVMYLFLHFMKHFYTSGVGIRQLCDLAFAITSNLDNIEVSLLQQYIAQLKLKTEWNNTLKFLSESLGMPSILVTTLSLSHIPIYTRIMNLILRQDTKSIWYECKKKGNFGHKEENFYIDKREQYSKVYIVRNYFIWKQKHDLFVRKRQIAFWHSLREYLAFLETFSIQVLRKIRRYIQKLFRV